MKLGRKEQRIAQLQECADAGFTMRETAQLLEVTYRLIANYATKHGIAFKHQPHPTGTGVEDPSRLASMATMYRSGYTLQQIGDQFKITRERVRQLLTKYHGISAKDGGGHARGERNRVDRGVRKEAKCLEKWGCSTAQYRSIRGKISLAFGRQKSNARTRKIEWKITLWQWWTIWQASGHWEHRGRGYGYCMCRRGDEGPYSPGNVFIATCAQNSSEGNKKSDLPLGVTKPKKSAGYVAGRAINGKRRCLGIFPTPELAHAAYLMSIEQARAA